MIQKLAVFLVKNLPRLNRWALTLFGSVVSVPGGILSLKLYRLNLSALGGVGVQDIVRT